jgi:leucyl-tRNA synthetase
LLVGEFAHEKVRNVKEKIREKLLSENLAVKYSEPEKEPVISRSGDKCVVGLVDQWYITYGDSQWKPVAEKSVNNLFFSF